MMEQIQWQIQWHELAKTHYTKPLCNAKTLAIISIYTYTMYIIQCILYIVQYDQNPPG